MLIYLIVPAYVRGRALKDSSNSGREFGWVLGQLRSGVESEIVHYRLLRTAIDRGKRNPGKYTDRTITKALRIIGNG